MAFLQPHGFSIRIVGLVGSHHRGCLPVRFRHGPPRTLYALPVPVTLNYPDVDTYLVNETRRTEDEDALFTPYMRDDISETSTEKVEFPPLGHPVPTFSSAFKSNDKETPSEKPQFPNPQMGPRFFHGSTIPFDQQTILKPAPAHTREQPPASIFATPHLYQYDGDSNNHSRTNSDASADYSITRSVSDKKRWIIE